MIALLSLAVGFVRGPLRGFLTTVPRMIWYCVALALLSVGLFHWHEGRIKTAYRAGATAQSAADRATFTAASATAARAQHDLVAGLAAHQSAITKGTADALAAKGAELARRTDDLRLRWTAYRADRGGSGQGRTAAVSGAAAPVDDATCATRGWVDFDTAAAAAGAADAAIAKDDAWIAWAGRQAAAWPRPVPVDRN